MVQAWKSLKYIISYQLKKLSYAQSTDKNKKDNEAKDSNFENKILQIKDTMVIF